MPVSADASITRPRRLCPIPAADCTRWHAFQDLNGAKGMTFYHSSPFDLRPLVSFQVYVTHDRDWSSDAHRDADMAQLAEDLYTELLGATEPKPTRLDIHFLGPLTAAETVEKCIAHYHAALKAYADDPQKRLVPSHAREPWDCAGFLITVPTADWKEHGGLGLLHFDRAEEDPELLECAGGSGQQPPDPHYVYPNECNPDALLYPNLESCDLRVRDCGNLWSRSILDIYTFIPVLEEWQQQYWDAYDQEWLIYYAERDLEKKAKDGIPSDDFDEAAALQYLKTTTTDSQLYASRHINLFQDVHGRRGFSVYEAGVDVQPPLCFQVYITHATSEDLDDASQTGHRVFDELFTPGRGRRIPASMQTALPHRIDVHFMGDVAASAAPAACIAHYRAAQLAYAADPARRLVPSYASARNPWHGFLTTVPRDDWESHGGLGLVYFDAVGDACPGSVKYVYPTRALGPGKPPLERQRHWLALSGYGASLWSPAIAEVYDGVPVRAEWQEQYRQAYDAALEQWARGEMARRRQEWKRALEELARRKASRLEGKAKV